MFSWGRLYYGSSKDLWVDKKELNKSVDFIVLLNQRSIKRKIKNFVNYLIKVKELIGGNQ